MQLFHFSSKTKKYRQNAYMLRKFNIHRGDTHWTLKHKRVEIIHNNLFFDALFYAQIE